MGKNILADSREQSTFLTQLLNKENLNAIANAAKNIAESFDSDSAIGQSYANLAEAVVSTRKILTQLTSNIVEEKEFKVCHIKTNGAVEYFNINEDEKINLLEDLICTHERAEKTSQIIIFHNAAKHVYLNLKTDEDFEKYEAHLNHEIMLANSPVCPQCLAMEPGECEC